MDPQPPGTREETDGLWDWNLATGQVHFSPRWIALIGCEDHEVGNSPDEWLGRVHPDDLSKVHRELVSARADGTLEFSVQHRLRHQDGTYRWMSCRGAAVRNDSGQVIRLRGSHSDVTPVTVTDPLTGLPNQLLFNDRLNHSIDRARRYPGFRFALLLVDIARPPGSAASGIIAGDPLLTTTARRLETCLRIGDTTATLRNNDLVARLHEDRFAVLLDGLKDVSHAKIVADRLLSELLAPVTVNGRDMFLTASIGVAVSVTGYQQSDEVMRDAGIAVHRARVLGGSHCEIFDTAALKSEQAELRLEADFAAALERREFELFYQPVIALGSNALVGFEALIRWKHPVLGFVAPQDFITLAEKTGFIVPLGEWILREACCRLKEWQRDLPTAGDLWMSVNLSGVQLKHPDLLNHVAAALRESGIDAHCLVLELTEGTAMENPTAVKTLLMELRARGVRISIDDFGTGYSSLAYLRQFPIDTLKVDRSFVRGMETHKAAADIVGNLTAMAQQLGVQVVAEGIENEEQLTLLRALQCQSAQGFLFAKPLDVAGAAEFIRTGVVPESGRMRQQTDPTPAAATKSSPLSWPAGTGLRSRLAAGAAAMFVLAYIGVAGRLTSGPVPLPQSPSSPRMPAAAVAQPIPAPRGNIAIRTRELPVSPPPLPAARTGGTLATPPSAAAQRRPHQLAIGVAHQHRIGSCKGRLVVSEAGVAFVPDDSDNRDAFAFGFSDFLQTIEGDTLTIKTASRTYRFKTAGAPGTGDGAAGTLRQIADGIASFR